MTQQIDPVLILGLLVVAGTSVTPILLFGIVQTPSTRGRRAAYLVFFWTALCFALSMWSVTHWPIWNAPELNQWGLGMGISFVSLALSLATLLHSPSPRPPSAEKAPQ